MSKYKRLTNKNWKENYDIFEDVCCDTCAEDCGECERNFNALVRLAELEDKIEAGKVVELPCSLGEHFVIQDYGFGRFYVEKVLIVGYNFNMQDSLAYPVDSYDNWYLPSRVFDTEEEASRARERLENM